MRVIVVCEFSGIVRRAFRRCGHEAWSADLQPAEDGSPAHFTGDVFETVEEWEYFDLAICHPPCTYLSSSGIHWLHRVDPKVAEWWRQPAEQRHKDKASALEFVYRLRDLPVPRIAIENPIGILSSEWRKPDQIIQPWQFGHGDTKATCLWLKNLPLLRPTFVVAGRNPGVISVPGKDRQKIRSRTYKGIAEAMAEQWGAERPLPSPEDVFERLRLACAKEGT